jgi:hypothetical protein
MSRFLIGLGLALLIAGLLWPYLRLPADDMLALERAVQPGLLGRKPVTATVAGSRRLWPLLDHHQ